MCGIAGYFCFGDKKPPKSVVNSLLIESKSRGEDSTGVTFIEDDVLRVIKSSQDAEQFVNENEEWSALEVLPRYMAMHCRKTTRGSTANNMNNHPVFRDGLALVHNGTISNDTELYKEFGFKRDGEVDTEVILALLESERAEANWECRAKTFNLLEGTFAIAAIDTVLPDTMCFARHDRPLWFAVDVEDDILYFGSTKDILSDSITIPYKNLIDITKRLSYWELKNDEGITVDIDGHVSTFNIKPAVPKHTTTTYSGGRKTIIGERVCSECFERFLCNKPNKGKVYSSLWCPDFN